MIDIKDICNDSNEKQNISLKATYWIYLKCHDKYSNNNDLT